MFSWSSGGRKAAPAPYPAQRNSTTTSTTAMNNPIPPVPTYRSVKHSRHKHIQSYLTDPTLKPSTRRVRSDDSTYDTVFQTKAGDALILRVHLPVPPPEMAPTAPSMTLVGVRCSHPWLDSKMRVVKYSSMASDETWESSGLLLGKAVNEVIKHLQLNPPTNITITDPQLKKIQATISRPPDAQHQRMPSHPPRQSSFDAPPDYETLLHAQPSTTDDMHIPMPTIPAQFSQIEAMGKSEIKALLDSEQSFREFAQTVMSGEALFDLRDEIKEGNLEMARANLEKEEDLKKLHASVASLRLDLKTSLEALNGLQERHKELCGPRDRRDLMRRLNQAKRQALDESEEIATEWVEGKSEKSVEEFLETFLERRTIHHMRASKLEKLQTEGF